jgi:hypothetical protein
MKCIFIHLVSHQCLISNKFTHNIVVLNHIVLLQFALSASFQAIIHSINVLRTVAKASVITKNGRSCPVGNPAGRGNCLHSAEKSREVLVTPLVDKSQCSDKWLRRFTGFDPPRGYIPESTVHKDGRWRLTKFFTHQVHTTLYQIHRPHLCAIFRYSIQHLRA